jgi:hypothetical protein
MLLPEASLETDINFSNSSTFWNHFSCIACATDLFINIHEAIFSTKLYAPLLNKSLNKYSRFVLDSIAFIDHCHHHHIESIRDSSTIIPYFFLSVAILSPVNVHFMSLKIISIVF